MTKEEYPNLEIDEDKNALIRPFYIFQPIDIAERCVLCNFGQAIEKILEEYSHKIGTYFEAESIKLPIYGTAVQIEVLTALGCRKYIACSRQFRFDLRTASSHSSSKGRPD